MDETLRVNGTAVLSQAPEDVARCTNERRAPVLVVRVTVIEADLHCGKALMRFALWSPATQVTRSVLPTMGQMLADQTGLDAALETTEAMQRRYAPVL